MTYEILYAAKWCCNEISGVGLCKKHYGHDIIWCKRDMDHKRYWKVKEINIYNSWQISRVIVHREPIKQKKVSFTIHIMSYTDVQSRPRSSIKILINHSRTCLTKVSNWTALILMKVVLGFVLDLKPFLNSSNKLAEETKVFNFFPYIV